MSGSAPLRFASPKACLGRRSIDAGDSRVFAKQLIIRLPALHRLRRRFRVRQRGAVAAVVPVTVPACPGARGAQGVRLGVFPALALFDQLGPRRSQLGAHAFQRVGILRVGRDSCNKPLIVSELAHFWLFFTRIPADPLKKNPNVAADGLQNETNERREHHGAEAGDCCNCMTGRQVSKQRRKTRPPALMCGSGQPGYLPHGACSQHDDVRASA